MCCLLYCKAEARRAMLRDGGRYMISRLLVQYAVKPGVRDHLLRDKSPFQPELHGRDGMRRRELTHTENEIVGIAVNQVPMIALKFVIDALGKSGRAVEVHGFLAPDQQTEKMIESNKMIDMRMRDEDLVDALYLPRRQRGDFPEIDF